jgi:hypothetical protein
MPGSAALRTSQSMRTLAKHCFPVWFVVPKSAPGMIHSMADFGTTTLVSPLYVSHPGSPTSSRMSAKQAHAPSRMDRRPHRANDRLKAVLTSCLLPTRSTFAGYTRCRFKPGILPRTAWRRLGPAWQSARHRVRLLAPASPRAAAPGSSSRAAFRPPAAGHPA